MPLTSVEKRSMANILSKILLDEESSAYTYEIAGNAVNDEEVRHMLLEMAEAERKHASEILSILGRLTGHEAPSVSILLAELKQHMEAETRAIQRYRRLYRYSLDSSLQERLERIIEESRRHRETIGVVCNLLKAQK